VSARIAVVGPGRVGAALGRRWVESGLDLIGFLGREPARAARAVAFARAGRVLRDVGELGAATVVLLAVPDDALAAVAAEAAAARAPRRASLWFHASGFHPASILAPLSAAGARIGAMHPVCPFPSDELGYRGMPGQPAVIEGPRASRRPLAVLARRALLVPLAIEAADRPLYHAACALAANGATALFDAAAVTFARSAPELAARGGELTRALMQAALEAIAGAGPERALSGPAARGDVEVVAAHLAALRRAAPELLPLYAALTRRAAAVAERAGTLEPRAAAALRALLAKEEGPCPS
jgi:predicted short-subunit dehydrogenase-like oxidoreductase (DUF2520 family)